MPSPRLFGHYSESQPIVESEVSMAGGPDFEGPGSENPDSDGLSDLRLSRVAPKPRTVRIFMDKLLQRPPRG